MTKRILSALIGAPLLLFLTWLGGVFLALLVVGLALLSLREFLEIGRKAGLVDRAGLIVFFAVLWLAVFLAGYSRWLLPLGVVWFVFVFGLYALSFPERSFAQASFGFLALIYPVGFFAYLYYLRELPNGLAWCYFVFFTVWVTDSGAFFIGNALGQRKLAPKVSPNKSVEGAVGGLLAAFIFGLIYCFITQAAPLPGVLVLALLTSVASQIGDLFESALKRMAGVKDSGHLIPGHGGILDRFDSFLFALPVVYVALNMGIVGM